ncbi:MAG: 5-amino-6-(D-ribitylamino)uracil--L-tyrosine 4-hydroxyphenyl transferase CofH [Candidatus Acidiferrales bacterium]
MPATAPATSENAMQLVEQMRDATLRGALQHASPQVAQILERALEARETDFQDALTLARLARTGDADLIAMLKTADELRRRAVGEAITYVVNRNLNFTNICFVGCAFCGFSRGPNSPDAYFHANEAMIAKTRQAVELGATEICIQGGLPRDLDPFYYRDLLRDIKAATPQIHIHAFSPMEIVYGVEKTGMPLREYLQMLKDAGLGSIPGTAAEILDDRVRQELSPNKLKVEQWIEVVRTAHSLGIASTSTMMYGHTEQPEDWVRHILLLRRIQKETRGFTEFVPLGFIHSNTRLFRIGGARPGSTIAEHLGVHALSRILLDLTIRNLQVSWVKLGFEMSLACLDAGANDFSGTLMEESISKAAGANFGEYVEPAQFRSLIRSIGRIPAERTTTYQIRQTFPVNDPAEPHLPAPGATSVRSFQPSVSGTGY